MKADLQMNKGSFRAFETDLARIDKAVDKALSDRIKLAVVNIHRKAVQAVKVDLGGLKNSIRMSFGKVASVYETAKYGPYVEFGTGGLVDVPSELTEYAMQFKGKGIRKVNLPARPYFFPAVFAEREAFLKFWEKYRP